MTIKSFPFRIATVAIPLLLTSAGALADTVLETETAELGAKGESLISNSVQFEKTRDGRTAFSLTQWEYGISDRAEILIEPFFYEVSKPKDGKKVHGVGDLEITPSYMVVLDDASSWTPAVVLAFKFKVPTANNRDIGSGHWDYYPYVILGKKLGDWLLNANLGVDFIGKSNGDTTTKNQLIYDFSVERVITPNLSVFAEVFGNSKPEDGAKGTFSGAIATEYHLTKGINVFVSVGYDSDHVFNVRPGINFIF